jgi:uncharacterized membrane protein YidH (DUF202 family)
MAKPEDAGQKTGLSDYLAAERTLLAWIRTGLALMGFGFVVARFGLFLQQIQAMQSSSNEQTYGLSLWFGTLLIAAGVLVNVFAGWHYARYWLSQSPFFWRWLDWQWRYIWFQSGVSLLRI